MSQLHTIYDDLPNSIDGILLRMNQELTCPICLTLFNQCVSTPCGHLYCRHCIVHSLETLSKCPICKETISKRSLYSSDSVESIVQEFLILRHQYEKDSGKVLTQLPSRLYQVTPQTDLSQLYPYPSKQERSNVNGEPIQQPKQQQSLIAATPAQSDQLDTPMEQRQQNELCNVEPSIAEQSNAAVPTTTTTTPPPTTGFNESSAHTSLLQQQPSASTAVQQQQSQTIPNFEAESEISLEQRQQNESSTLSLLLWPPESPLLQQSMSASPNDITTPPSSSSLPPPPPPPPPSSSSSLAPPLLPPSSSSSLSVSSPPPPPPLSSSLPQASQHNPDSQQQQQRPFLQPSLIQAFESLKAQSPRSQSPSSPDSTNDTMSDRIMIYTVSQLESTTALYLEELQTQGKLELTKEAHVSSKVTHFVFPGEDAQGIQNVTGAYLQALVLRKQIVHEYWIHECYQTKTMVDAIPFSTSYIGGGEAYYKAGPIRARQSALCKEPPLFHGKSVYFHDSVSGKLKKQFTNLMIAGGGQVIQNKQGMTSDTMILCQSLSKNRDDLRVAALRSLYGNPPISIVWMTQSILRYELLSEQDFIIRNLDSGKVNNFLLCIFM